MTLAHRFEQVYDWGMPVSDIAVQRDRAQRALWDRTAAVAGALNAAHAELVDIAAQLLEGRHWGDGGFRSVEHYLVVRAGLSPAHARDVAAVARRRAELPVVAKAVAAGELSLDQAAVVAHHVPAGYQRSVGELARHMTVPQLRRAMSRHAFAEPTRDLTGDTRGDDQDAGPQEPSTGTTQPADCEAVRRACARPELSMGYDRDGRFQLRYSAPATVGALVEQAVREAKDALFLQTRGAVGPGVERPSATGGPSPTHADAFELLAHRSLAAAGRDDGDGPGKGTGTSSRADRYRVYVHLSTDSAWVNARGALPRVLVDRLLEGSLVQPVWETGGHPVSVGRAMRILPDRARRLVADRDRGCRFPGCTATRFMEVHHLTAWADGGGTDLANQVSLCPFHHDAVTRGDVTITGHPGRPDGLMTTNRHGIQISGGQPPGPPSTEIATSPRTSRTPPLRVAAGAGPDRATAYRPPTGERARWADIELTPDRDLRPRAPALS